MLNQNNDTPKEPPMNDVPMINALILAFKNVGFKPDRSEWRNMIYCVIYNDSLRVTRKP